LFSYSSDVVGIAATSNGESPVLLYTLGKQNLSGNEDLTNSTPSLVNKNVCSINDFHAGDLQGPELLGWQAVPLQGIHHEDLDITSADAFELDKCPLD